MAIFKEATEDMAIPKTTIAPSSEANPLFNPPANLARRRIALLTSSFLSSVIDLHGRFISLL